MTPWQCPGSGNTLIKNKEHPMDNTFENEPMGELDPPLADSQEYARELLAEGFSQDEVTALYGQTVYPTHTQVKQS